MNSTDEIKDAIGDAGSRPLTSRNSDFTAVVGGNRSKLNDFNMDSPSKQGHTGDQSMAQVDYSSPVSVSASELGTDLDIGSLVEVDISGAKQRHFGVIRWMGVLRDRDTPFVGVELVGAASYFC